MRMLRLNQRDQVLVAEVHGTAVEKPENRKQADAFINHRYNCEVFKTCAKQEAVLLKFNITTLLACFVKSRRNPEGRSYCDPGPR